MIECKERHKINADKSKVFNVLRSLEVDFDSLGFAGDGASSRNRTYDLRINSPSL